MNDPARHPESKLVDDKLRFYGDRSYRSARILNQVQDDNMAKRFNMTTSADY